MRKLLSFHLTSLDGYYEGPNQQGSGVFRECPLLS